MKVSTARMMAWNLIGAMIAIVVLNIFTGYGMALLQLSSLP